MATTRSFSAMLNEYAPTRVFKEELLKRDWLLQNIEKDEKWLGGNIIVPFIGAQASSIEFGQLAADTDISEFVPVRGTISGYKEAYGSLVFNATDLMQHGQVNEQNLLKILPDQIEQFVAYFKEVMSQHLLIGSHFATLTADSDTGGAGLLTVDKIDRFQIGQKFYLDDGNSSPQALYVTAVNVNTNVVTCSDSRGGSAYNMSGAYTTAQSAKCYHPGAQGAPFSSIKGALLSLANGGDTNIHGVAKTAYPILQAVNVSGASITKANILETIFDTYTSVRQKAKGNASVVVCSFKHLGSIMKLVEVRNGMYSAPKPPNVSMYGWTEIEVVSVRGALKIVGIQEMDDDTIFLLDPKSMTFRSNGMFRRIYQPDGNEYYTVRSTSGYKYILDHALFGELEIRAPGHNAVIYSVANYS